MLISGLKVGIWKIGDNGCIPLSLVMNLIYNIIIFSEGMREKWRERKWDPLVGPTWRPKFSTANQEKQRPDSDSSHSLDQNGIFTLIYWTKDEINKKREKVGPSEMTRYTNGHTEQPTPDPRNPLTTHQNSLFHRSSVAQTLCSPYSKPNIPFK